MPSDRDYDFLAGGGQMGAIMRARDWSRTPLGSPDQWPQSLRTSVSTCLNCAFPILIWWGPDLVKLYNDFYVDILGAKHPDALGSPGQQVWPEIWDVIGPMLGRVLSRGEATRAQDLLLPLRRHGYDEECYFSFSYSPIRDETGGVGGVFCPVIETTERVIGERRLHLLRAVAERAADRDTPAQACASAAGCLQDAGLRDFPLAAIYLLDEQAGLAQLAGHAGSNAPPWPETLPLTGLLAAALSETGDSVLLDRAEQTLGELPAGGDGESRGRFVLLPFATGGARPAGFMLAGLNPNRPLDEMRGFAELVGSQIATAVVKARAHQEERRRTEALAALDRAKTAFFSNVSHEFRTPLTLMLGPLHEAIAKPDATPLWDVRPLVETAARNALRLQRLVNALLDFSRIEAGRLQARYRRTDLARLTTELASNFQASMERAGLRYAVACETLSRPAYVDPALWENIVLNLLSNAFKFTLQGEVRVELTESDGEAVLTVLDTGIGIAADQLPHVFERFHRIEDARGRSHEGTGIGLALVSDLVRLHGGEVTVASEPDRGSAFTVRLPLGREHLPDDRVTEAEADHAVGTLASAFVEEVSGWIDNSGAHDPIPRVPDDRAATILLADDNADMRAYVRRLLEAAGHRVIAAADGEAALTLLRTAAPDLVLSDVMMPRLDGLGLLRAIRRDARLAEVPVVLLSARAGEDARVAGLESAADDYLVKPFAARELLARVNANLATAALRRQAREELRTLNDRLEQLVAERTAERDRLWELSEDLLLLADYDGHLLRLSPSWSRLLGHDEEYLLSENYERLTHPDDYRRSMAQVFEMRRTGQPVRFENRLLNADGTHRWIAWMLSPIRGDSDDSMIGIGRDVTQERAGRDAIEEANRQLRAQIEERERVEAELRQLQRLEAVGQLTSGVAHDFNNLLTVISGALELLERDPGHPAAARRLAMIRSAAQRGAKLTGQLLAFARKQRLDPRPVDLNEAILGMGDLLRGTLGGTVRLEVALKPDLWPALADQGQLELVVLNLAINARDAMPVGGALSIETSNATLGPPRTPLDPGAGDYVAISVTDRGTGMKPEVLERAFEPFFTTKGPGKGSGLGLAQVYGFAKQSGGGVRIDTKVGEGTSIQVFLPRAEPLPRAEAGEGPETPAERPERPRLLLVDDDRDVREVTFGMLEAFGYQVAAAGSGAAALDLLERHPGFDLCLFDFAMPGMNGVELARRVEVRHPGLPIVFFTGYADRKAMDEIGSRPVVLKPFQPDHLAATLREAVGSGGARGNVVRLQRGG